MTAARPRPQPTRVSQPYWDALAEGRIDIQRCDACGAWVHYPRSRCPVCLSDRLGWRTVSGEATVYAYTVAVAPTAPVFADDVPQLIAVVELADGPRLTTTLVDADPNDIRIGMPVFPVFEPGDDGVTLLRFRP